LNAEVFKKTTSRGSLRRETGKDGLTEGVDEPTVIFRS